MIPTADAREHVAAYLNGLVWDGEPWCGGLAFAVNPEEPRPDAFRRFFRNAVTRAYAPERPGERHLVLLGPFGVGKTALVRSIVPVGWFASLWFREAAADRDGMLREPYIMNVLHEQQPGAVIFTGKSIDSWSDAAWSNALFDIVHVTSAATFITRFRDQLWAEAVANYKARRGHEAAQCRPALDAEEATERVAREAATKGVRS